MALESIWQIVIQVDKPMFIIDRLHCDGVRSKRKLVDLLNVLAENSLNGEVKNEDSTKISDAILYLA
jgi:hypothetical protein